MAGCERPHDAKGLCSVHSQRLRRTGNLLWVRTPGRPITDIREIALRSLAEQEAETDRGRAAGWRWPDSAHPLVNHMLAALHKADRDLKTEHAALAKLVRRERKLYLHWLDAPSQDAEDAYLQTRNRRIAAEGSAEIAADVLARELVSSGFVTEKLASSGLLTVRAFNVHTLTKDVTKHLLALAPKQPDPQPTEAEIQAGAARSAASRVDR